MKIFAGGIATETNTFAPILTGAQDFLVLRGADPAKGKAEHAALDLTATWGKQAQARGDEFIFSLMAWAQPSGITLRSAYESLRDEMLRDLQEAMPVDIVLLMLHGAMVADGYEDCEQDIIRRVRKIVGPGVVIGVELDLHCHLSREKIADADIVVLYKEYPHVDCDDRAREVFDLCVSCKLGEIRPTTALFDCQMAGLYPTSRQPLRGFVDAMSEAEQRDKVLSLSFGHGFQFADVPNMGAKVLAITDDDQALADRVAEEFGRRVHRLRKEIGFDSVSLPLEEALAKAALSSRGPVVVADQSDNPGGGAPGDATFALRWVLDHGVSGVALAILYDPGVVANAQKAGTGSTLQVRVGGKTSRFSGDPIDIEVTVGHQLNDYLHEFPQRSGDPAVFPAGDVVVLSHGDIDIVVSNARCQCFSPSIFTDLGIQPAGKKLLIVKSAQHFQEAFAPIASEIIYMAGPGAVSPNPRQIVYTHVDTSRMYPWVDSPMIE